MAATVSTPTDQKPYDRALPFTRVGSPSRSSAPSEGFQRPAKLSGDGRAQGTRRPEDFVVRSLIDVIRRKVTAVVPSWVPSLSLAPEDEAFNDQEIQGVLVKSFQTWTDTPIFQWHSWYDWNFHLIPDPEFDWLRCLGNGVSGAALGEENFPAHNPFPDSDNDADGRGQFTVPGNVMELEWDTGALSKTGKPESAGGRPGPMFINAAQQKEWAWPMAGHRIWARGRSIYDGGHEGPDTSATKGLCRSELHPCRAIAWTRYEAFLFKEHDKHTPAVQFMFFSSRFGTPIDHPDIKPKDGNPYVFIVDLPLAPADPHDVDIEDSATVQMNTVFLRKLELVHDFDRQRYNDRARADVPPADVDPEIKLLDRLPDPSDPRKRQAQITIPLAALSGDAYGVLISLGWRDFSGTAAKRVKKCKVTLKQVTQHSLKTTAESGWRLKFGVNGRWFQFDLTGMDEKRQVRSLKDASAEIFLEIGDRLEFSAHGAVIRPVDAIYTGGEIRVPVLASIPIIGRLFRFHPTDGTDRSRTLFIGERDIAAEENPDPNIVEKIIENFIVTPLDILSLFIDAMAGGQGPTGTLGRRPVVWNQDVDTRPPLPRTGPAFTRMRPVQRAVLRRAVQMMADTWSMQNKALGLIDGRPIGILDSDPNTIPSSITQDKKFERSAPKERGPVDPQGKPIGPGPGNPYVVSQADIGKGPMALTLTGYETWELGATAELVERPHTQANDADRDDWKDYHIDLTIEVTEQT